MEEPLEEDCPLGDDDGDEHGEGDRREAVPPQERHQEAEPAEQHHVHVQRRWKQLAIQDLTPKWNYREANEGLYVVA